MGATSEQFPTPAGWRQPPGCTGWLDDWSVLHHEGPCDACDAYADTWACQTDELRAALDDLWLALKLALAEVGALAVCALDKARRSPW